MQFGPCCGVFAIGFDRLVAVRYILSHDIPTVSLLIFQRSHLSASPPLSICRQRNRMGFRNMGTRCLETDFATPSAPAIAIAIRPRIRNSY
jgi:hypothetical protein